MQWKSFLMVCLLVIFAQEVYAEDAITIVIIKDFQFSAKEITIKRGATVRWENQEKRQYHNVWFEASGEEEPDYLFPDEFYERVFDKIGSFPYRCGPHPKMTGIVHVIE
ncbi:MAG: plastocyanin/azurin family copper-binding protein [Xanthomonadales bacterium]|nr:plastocyanin/azurin family copper-binding protein [Xanthomonadales bacterium]